MKNSKVSKCHQTPDRDAVKTISSYKGVAQLEHNINYNQMTALFMLLLYILMRNPSSLVHSVSRNSSRVR